MLRKRLELLLDSRTEWHRFMGDWFIWYVIQAFIIDSIGLANILLASVN